MAPRMVALLCFLVALSSAQAASEVLKGKHFDRIVVVVLENADYNQVLENEYFRDLLTRRGTRLLSNYRAVDNSSVQANYFSMISGATYNATDGTAYNVDEMTIIDRLEDERISWRAYVEGYPGNCSNVTASDYHYIFWPAYVREHNPFMSFSSIAENEKRCAKIVSSNLLEEDIGDKKVPQVVFHLPNQFNNGHYYGIIGASNWLSGWLEPKLANDHFMKNTVVLLTFSKPASATDKVFAILIGEDVVHKKNDTEEYSHYSIMATIEENWDLKSLTENDRHAIPFQGLRTPKKPHHKHHDDDDDHKKHHDDDDDHKKHHDDEDDDDDDQHHDDDDDDEDKHDHHGDDDDKHHGEHAKSNLAEDLSLVSDH